MTIQCIRDYALRHNLVYVPNRELPKALEVDEASDSLPSLIVPICLEQELI